MLLIVVISNARFVCFSGITETYKTPVCCSYMYLFLQIRLLFLLDLVLWKSLNPAQTFLWT